MRKVNNLHITIGEGDEMVTIHTVNNYSNKVVIKHSVGGVPFGIDIEALKQSLQELELFLHLNPRVREEHEQE